MAETMSNESRNNDDGTPVAAKRTVNRLITLAALSILAVAASSVGCGDKNFTQKDFTGGAGTGTGTGTGTGQGGSGDGGAGAEGGAGATGGAGGTGGMGTGGAGTGGMAAGGMGGMGTGGTGMAPLLHEPFDDALGFTKTDGNGVAASFFAYAPTDYWGITDGSSGGDFGADAAPSGIPPYASFTGSFMVAQDMDADDLVLPISMTWPGMDITNLTDLEVSLSVAEGIAGDGLDDIDADDFLRIRAVIDGGAPITVLELRGDKTINGELREDTNLDGIGDGGVAVGPAATVFTKSIGATGLSLQISVSMSFDAGDEDIAIDDLVVTGVQP
jgi:hypothetical protein